jgi:hypothetical protein
MVLLDKKEMCVFTIVQNDALMAERWIKYYERHFSSKDIYILDHLLYGKSCTDHIASRCNVIKLVNDFSFDHDWLKSTVEKQQIELLKGYRKVLFAEIDEFIVPDPDLYDGLEDYINRFNSDSVRVSGYNVIQVEGEPDIDLNQDCFLAQRSHWIYSLHFSKPLLTTVALDYTLGFHNANGFPESKIDRNLYLIHLKWMCYKHIIEKNKEACSRIWCFQDWHSMRGFEHKVLDVDHVKNYISNMGEPEEIPNKFRGLL